LHFAAVSTAKAGALFVSAMTGMRVVPASRPAWPRAARMRSGLVCGGKRLVTASTCIRAERRMPQGRSSGATCRDFPGRLRRN